MREEIHVAAYCRVSTDKEDQANSLASQRSYFQDFIQKQEGWELYGIYYDEGISGTQTTHRQGFLDMLQDALYGPIDLILTKEVSRFARNTVDTLTYTRKLKAAGVGVIFTIDNIDTRDSDGELRLTIMASIAQEESRKTSQRVRWGQKRRMEQGVVFGGDLLGYTVSNGKIYVNPQEVPAVKAIFHKYTNEGKGTCMIARELTEEGWKPPKGRKWSHTVLLKILRNEKYVGDLCQKKTITPDYLTHEKKYNRGEEEMVYLTDHHEAIIDRSLWERTQQELRRRSPGKDQGAKHNNRYWYSARLYCGECGACFVSKIKKRKDGTIYKGFRCARSAKEGSRKWGQAGEMIGCDSIQVNEQTLFACLKFVIKQIPVNRERLKKEILWELKNLTAQMETKQAVLRLEREMEALQEKKSRAVDLFMDGMITKEELCRQKAWYDEKIQGLQKRLELEIKQEGLKNRQQEIMEQSMAVLDHILDLQQGSEWLYREVLDKMVINKDSSLDIFLKCLPGPIHLCFRSHGRGENFTTDIVDAHWSIPAQ